MTSNKKLKYGFMHLGIVLLSSALVGVPALTAPATVSAGGSSISGGGHEIALEFHKAFAASLATITKELPEILSASEASMLREIARTAKVIVVNTALTTPHGGVVQFSIAENYPDKKLIFVNRTRWSALRNIHVREALALHEMASLVGLESTGRYPISARYIAHFALKPSAFEPVKGRCFAPRNQKSSCEELTPLRQFLRYEAEITRDIENTRTKQHSKVQESARGQQAVVFDENKIYTMQFSGNNTSAPQIVLSVLSEIPTGDPNQAEVTVRTRSYFIRGGNAFPNPKLFTRQFLMNRVDGRNAQGVYVDAKTGRMYGGFFNDFHADGSSLHHSFEYGLSIPFRDNWLIRSIHSDQRNFLTKEITSLGSLGMSDEDAARAMKLFNEFARKSAEVSQIKASLNSCRERCALIRANYEKADRERDSLFFKML